MDNLTLFEECKSGNVPAFRYLVQQNESILEEKSVEEMDTVLHVATRFGHNELPLEIIRLRPEMVSAENKKMDTPLHEAAFVGSTDVVREILKLCPYLASARGSQGFSPLHIASGKGHLEIVKEILRIDSNLTLLQDDEGRTPFHLAAMNGHVVILREILFESRSSLLMLTRQRETALHLSVKCNQYKTLKFLAKKLTYLGEDFQKHYEIDFINMPDGDGNTVIHLAAARKLSKILTYMVKTFKLNGNELNENWFTALDLLENCDTDSETQYLRAFLRSAGGKRSNKLASNSPIRRITSRSTSQGTNRKHSNSTRSMSPQTKQFNPLANRHPHNHRSGLNKERELHMESLQNARNTIVIVAVLIATVTFAAGLTPPGGVYQDGPMIGRVIMGRTTSFKVFMLSNHVALFFSLSIVILLVSVIPFKRKSMMRILVVAHKIMCVAVSFMAVAYVAGTWSIMPHVKGTRWILVALLSIGGGSMVSIFFILGLMLARHWLRKLELRKKKQHQKKRNSSRVGPVEDKKQHIFNVENTSDSSNSDVATSGSDGWYPF